MNRTQFDSYLSLALNVPLTKDNKPANKDDKLLSTEGRSVNQSVKEEESNKDKRLKEIDESHYVLTLDYTVKVWYCMYCIRI